MTSYKNFIESASWQVKERLKSFEDQKDQGKFYENRIIEQFVGSQIIISDKAELNTNKEKKIISDILKTIPLIDEELYDKMVLRRKQYRQKYHPGKTMWLDEYISSNINWINENDIETLEERKRQLTQSYSSYKQQMQNKYKTWNNDMEEKLYNEKDIIDFINDRVNHNNNKIINIHQKNIQELDKEIQYLQSILNKRHSKEKEKNIINQLDILEAEYNFENQQYNERIDEAQDMNFQKTQKTKFRKKIVQLLHHYINSTEHADENLRKKYIELFLYDDLKQYISFSQWKEYNLQLWDITQEQINENQKELIKNLIAPQEKSWNKTKKKINFQQLSLF